MTTFSAETYQNEFLPDGASEVNAVVTVTATGDGGGGPTGAVGANAATRAAEVIIVDTSGSMNYPSSKIKAARRATAVAIDCLRDGIGFAVIAGTGHAEIVYPPFEGLAESTPATRADAKAVVARLEAGGGTAIGVWLGLALSLLGPQTGAIRHAILLTDGKDEGEEPAYLEQVLAACQGQFQCDCRGVGTDWVVSELRKIATALLGTVDIVADPSELEEDFRSMTEQAMGKAVSDVALRLWSPQGAEVMFVKQVSPTIEDLTARRQPVNALTAEYPTGAWGEESRDYHVCVRVRPAAVGAEMLAGRISLVVDGNVQSQTLVRAIWTDDTELSTRMNPEVAHYIGQADLAQAIQEGLEARKAGDDEAATAKLGRAVQLAAAAGNEATTRLLAKVVDVEDADAGTVRLKRDIDDADEMALDTRSTKTVRVRPDRGAG